MSRWIPKDQRELLEKQAHLLASRITKQAPASPSQVEPPQAQLLTQKQSKPQSREQKLSQQPRRQETEL